MDEVHPYEANINPLPYICNQTKPAKRNSKDSDFVIAITRIKTES